jgi:response regulator RpfG family c-di-GMP phosphodiesterase
MVVLVDVYDALIGSKVYDASIWHDKAVVVALTERASHFDRDVVDTFLEIHAELQTMVQRHLDTIADITGL